MTANREQVAPNRFREDFGRCFEDFNIGDIYEHRPGRTITESDNTWFTLLTMNQHPLHFDKQFAAQSEFGQPIVNSCLTLAIVAGMRRSRPLFAVSHSGQILSGDGSSGSRAGGAAAGRAWWCGRRCRRA